MRGLVKHNKRPWLHSRLKDKEHPRLHFRSKRNKAFCADERKRCPTRVLGQFDAISGLDASSKTDIEDAKRLLLPPILLCALSLWGTCAAAYALAQNWDRELCFLLMLIFGVLSVLNVLVFAIKFFANRPKEVFVQNYSHLQPPQPHLCPHPYPHHPPQPPQAHPNPHPPHPHHSRISRLLKKIPANVLVVNIGAFLGLSLALASSFALHTSIDAIEASPYATYTFTLTEDANTNDYGKTCLAYASVEHNERVLVSVSLPDEANYAHLRGDVFSARCQLKKVSGTSANRCWQKGASATVNIKSYANAQEAKEQTLLSPLLAFREAAIENLGKIEGNSGALLQALVCGYRENLNNTELYSDFKTCGLAHMVAVSGAHLVIVTSFVSSFLRCLRAPRMLSLILQILFVLAYLVFSAMPISAVRAAIMAIASSLSYTAKRKSAPLNALGLCIIALVATSPSAAVSVSFALSAGSTLGIILVSPLILSWFEPLKFPIPRFVKDALALTLAANIATLPASAALFSQASLIAPLANVVCSPLFALVCSVGLLASIFGSLPGLGCVISFVAELSSSAINTIVSMLAHVPFASIVVNAPVLPMIITSVLLTWLLWYFWPRASLGKFFACAGSFALAFCVWAALCPYAAGTCIVMLDVGQGDAFLIRSGGKTLLIDTGNKDQALKQALARQGIFKLDAILITHADDDHCGSLSSLRGVVEIDSVLVARDALSCSCSSCANLRESAYAVVDAQKCTGLMPGNTLSFGNVSLEVVWPYAFQEEGGNADSLCVLARFGNLNSANSNEKFVTALFCGDAESEQINEMQERGSVGEVDIYKVGHHGSRAALDDKAAKNLSARIALVSVGANNRYGHPSQETLERLESQGAHVFRSDEQGDVSCKIEGTSISVTTLR